jgi:RND family efflux transporter MFP subunit
MRARISIAGFRNLDAVLTLPIKSGWRNKMRFPNAVLLAPLIGLFLVACGGGEAPDEPPASRPVKLFVVEGAGDAAMRNFPGSVRSSRRADLAFRVPGVLQQMLVKEGQSVKEGQLLAQLDPTDFKITLEDRQATFDNAERNFKRAKELIVDGNISKLDYDRMEASFKTSRAALSQASQDLAYTELKAPFDGSIGQRLVENFEEVQAKQTIFNFQDNEQLDILIDMPETMVRSLRLNGTERGLDENRTEEDKLIAFARFEGRSEARFPLTMKEVATKADSQTQTFRVTLTMPAPAEFRVLSGMTANVEIDFSNLVAMDAAKWVPVGAVQADSGLNARVWALDESTMTVSSLPVTIGRMRDNRIEVVSGLRGGEEIVSVGAPYLAEGMRVTRMKQTEQAMPRQGESS